MPSDQRRKYRRVVRAVLFVLLATACLWVGVCCVVPSSMRQVKAPRRGRAYNNRVAIVYSKHYQMNMAGLERMHSFDIRKYAKIYLKLNTDGLLRPQDVFVPRQVTHEQILLVHNEAFLESLKDSRRIAEYLESPLVGKASAGGGAARGAN